MTANEAREITDSQNNKPCFTKEIEEAAKNGENFIVKAMYQWQLDQLVERGFSVTVFEQNKAPYNLYKISW